MPEQVLTPRQVAEIFERWDSGRYTQVELASWFGVSDGMIRKLLKEREEGRDRSKEGGGILQEGVAEEWIAIKKIEHTLGLISKVMGDIWSKADRTEKDWKELSVAKGSLKSLLDARKQLKELPKDLKEAAAAVDNEAMERLVSLIPEARRGEFLDIMRGLAQPRGQPSSDLGPKEE